MSVVVTRLMICRLSHSSKIWRGESAIDAMVYGATRMRSTDASMT
jgi:hypothetical protein